MKTLFITNYAILYKVLVQNEAKKILEFEALGFINNIL